MTQSEHPEQFSPDRMAEYIRAITRGFGGEVPAHIGDTAVQQVMLEPPTPTHSESYYRRHPVGRYISRPWESLPYLEVGEAVSIPTGTLQRTTFVKGKSDRPREWLTNQTAEEYRYMLFADQYVTGAPVAGGEQQAFQAGNNVLDVGSGEAVALLQLADAYPATTFIGVDIGYQERRALELAKAGVQLTHDDWHTLETVPTNSVDTILSQRGVVPWGISPQRPRSGEVVDALTRVAKPGAVWRFDVSEDTTILPFITQLLEERGWDVRLVKDRTGERLPTVVAIKHPA